MTLKEIRDMTYELLGVTSTNQKNLHPPSQLDSFINMAYRELQEVAEYQESTATLTVTAGTRYVDLPADFVAAKMVLYRNIPIEAIQFQMASWTANVPVRGRPFRFSIFQKRIQFDPVPNESGAYVTLYYWNSPITLVDNTDSASAIHPDFHQYMAMYAASCADRSMGNLQRAKIFRDDYDYGKTLLRDRSRYERQKANMLQVIPEWYGDWE